ncbi:MAG: DNA internalization-related competence protein ComEC/Rec2 [Thermoanaerobaculia bacterium]|jgi:competence protein ComEC|nr:DNA internalization-related competence protein ComEC/Rec2 [Thermoanaerobaculia bacterium]
MRRSWSLRAPSPAVPAALAFAAGILLAVELPIAPSPSLAFALAIAAAVAVAAGLRGSRSLAGAGGLLLVVLLAFARARPALVVDREAARRTAASASEDDVFEVRGRLGTYWSRSGSIWSARLDVEDARREGVPVALPGRLVLSVAGETHPGAHAGYGDLVRVRGPLRLPDAGAIPQSPFGLAPEPRLPQKSAVQIEVLDGPRGAIGVPARLHRAASRRLEEGLEGASPGEREAAALAGALVLGETDRLSPATVSAFRDGGVAHVLAISGLHVGLLALGLTAALGPFRPRPLTRDAIVLLATVAFAAFTGGRAPVLRAALMIGLYLGARLLGRPTSPGQVFGLSALVLLAHDPSRLFDVGFLLTYAAVFGISALSPVFARPLRERLPVPLADGLAATLGAELCVFPIQAAVFHVVPFVALVSNLLVVPVASVFLFAAVLHLPLLLAGPVVASLALAPLALLSDAMLGLLRLLDSVGAVRVVPTPSFAVAALLALFLAAAGVLRRRGPRRAALGGAVALVFLVSARPSSAARRGEARLIALDVGQGDSFLVVTEKGRVLVDGGGTFDAAYDFGRTRLLPRLAALGAVSFDAVVLSHPHPDHSRGLVALLRLVPVGRLYLPRGAPRNPFLDETLAAASGGRPPVEALAAGDRFRAAGVEFDVLHPGAESYPRAPENNGSLVVGVRLGSRRVLLTGDVEERAEADLVARGLDLAADVLKVPHHGSRTSTSAELLGAVRPRIALVSAGRRNRFGHPGREVIERLESSGTRVFRTDRHGDVELLFRDGRIFPSRPFAGLPGGIP